MNKLRTSLFGMLLLVVMAICFLFVCVPAANATTFEEDIPAITAEEGNPSDPTNPTDPTEPTGPSMGGVMGTVKVQDWLNASPPEKTP